MNSLFLITEYAHGWRGDTLDVKVLTDVTAHLWLLWTDIEPRLHLRSSETRGLAHFQDPDYCFVEWNSIDQDQPGDTLEHIFHMPGFTTTTKRWWRFIGQIAGKPSPSDSAIFTAAYGEENNMITLGIYGEAETLEGEVKLEQGSGVILTRDPAHNSIVIQATGGAGGIPIVESNKARYIMVCGPSKDGFSEAGTGTVTAEGIGLLATLTPAQRKQLYPAGGGYITTSGLWTAYHTILPAVLGTGAIFMVNLFSAGNNPRVYDSAATAGVGFRIEGAAAPPYAIRCYVRNFAAFTLSGYVATCLRQPVLLAVNKIAGPKHQFFINDLTTPVWECTDPIFDVSELYPAIDVTSTGASSHLWLHSVLEKQ